MDNNQISFPAIRVFQPLGEFFLGNISAQDLVKISYTDVRRIEHEQRDVEQYLGIQRPLDKARVKKIKQYLGSPDASFPTGVILSVRENCAEFSNGTMILRPFQSEFEASESISQNQIAKVLDGQHRIAAFLTDQGTFDNKVITSTIFEFNVVIFVGLDIDAQANIFATVNLAQTKVNKSLVYDLEGLSKTRSPFRTCHQIAVALDEVGRSPLYHRIKRLGVKTKGRDESEPLTQAAFVESLMKLISPEPFKDRTTYMNRKIPQKVSGKELEKHPFRNMFIEEKDQEIALIIHNYFKSIELKWPIAWNAIDKEGNILPRSNAFKAFMRFLRTAYLQLAQDEIGRVPTANEFGTILSNIEVTDEDFTSGNFREGSGGESQFFKLLKREVTIKDLKN